MKKTDDFDLEKAQAGASLATRAGYPVTVYSFCRRFPADPIVGVIHFPSYDFDASGTPQGKVNSLWDKQHDNDLMLCTE